MKSRNGKIEKFLLILVIAIGLFFRIYNLNWDSDHHLHPDERFLTMVGNAMSIPSDFAQYLDPLKSTFNPPNIGFSFFVYGLFPLTLNKLLAIFLGNDNYNSFTIQGRFLSTLFDTALIFLIFYSVKLLENKYKLNFRIKYFASFIYAISVLPIQLSHFFAVDTFLNFFTFASLFFALVYFLNKQKSSFAISGVLLGLGVASKITAVLILPLILALIINREKGNIKLSLLKSLNNVLFLGIISFITLKLSYPYMFVTGNLFDLRPNPLFIENLKAVSFLAESPNFPPALQWVNKTPIIFPLVNLILFGVGIPIFILFLFGTFIALKEKQFVFKAFIIWLIAFFLYQGSQTATTMRYFLILYPFIAVFSGIGLYNLTKIINKKYYFLIIILILAWPLMFLSIYTKSHTRVSATNWILESIPAGSTLLSEHWDDSLPLTSYSNYKIIQLPVFDPDTDEKWKIMDKSLRQGDYIILSSNRGYGSILSVPDRYPRMTEYYGKLFKGKLLFRKAKEFNSYPSLSYLGIPITLPDDFSEESFTVYDHPKVIIFEKIK